MSRKLLDLWVGVFVALGIGCIAVPGAEGRQSGGGQFFRDVPAEAKFVNIGGLKVRAPVKSAGVVVGRVADIRFDPATYEAVVSSTSTAAIVSRRIPSP
jgi:phospholipid/cholesterol/gamma-HCH transport system substrate-binding protein